VVDEMSAHGRRTSWNLAGFPVAACGGAAATLSWQSYGGPAEQMIANSVPQLSWLSLPSSAHEAANHQRDRVEQPSLPVAQAPAPQAVSAQVGAVASTVSETTASTAPAGPSPELQQLEAIAHDLVSCSNARR
jgi:hypothetical protein